MKKIGIIICDRYHTCAGGKCMRALREREGGFARHVIMHFKCIIAHWSAETVVCGLIVSSEIQQGPGSFPAPRSRCRLVGLPGNYLLLYSYPS